LELWNSEHGLLMDPTSDEPPPGCLVILLRVSAGMTAEVVTSRGETVGFAAVRMLADELVEALVNTVAAGYAVGEMDVAVLGYRAAEDGSPQLFSLLPDDEPKARLVPLARVAEMLAAAREAEGQPRKWAVIDGCEGEPCPATALAAVYQMVSVWLTGRFAARPPVVVHCTAADGLDEAYAHVARSLGLLSTGHGPVRLMHYVFEAGAEPTALGEPGALGPRWLELLELSGELPENTETGRPTRRALAVNDWDLNDLWDAVFSYSWVEDSVAWAEGEGGFSHRRAMWAQKMGNSPDQWEDAFAVAGGGGAAAVADGASTGIYCRAWADQLSEGFVSERPDARDPGLLNKWVGELRTEWRSAIRYDTLNWSKKAKVDSVGAAATLLGLEVGAADADGNRPWRAFAVGDACLFWLRDGRLLATFPVVAADQFGSAPLLIRSNPGFRTVALAARGTCQPADRFVLATDAVAVRLFKSAALGPGPEWSRFETIDQDAWRDELDTLRRANDMVNDDCTLIVLRVSGGPDEPPWPPATTHVEEEPAADAGVAVEEPVATVAEPVEQEAQDAAGTELPEAEAPPATEDEFAVTESVSDLVIERPAEEEPATDAANEPDEASPADEPPAARDGFPDSTDPGV
jgi:hypothetical protein